MAKLLEDRMGYQFLSSTNLENQDLLNYDEHAFRAEMPDGYDGLRSLRP